ncbi:MAG: FdhF/YdeP family oxidoreductase [Patulibacter sp.]|nr:FdhF/YdeP family oxidoreductase [Patulibacter sp.]
MRGDEHLLGRGRTFRDHAALEDDAHLEVTAPQDHAVGMPATISIARESMKHLGATRTLNTVARMNQAGGFDCPGCAWPEPEGGAHHLEFCENGVKAIAEEATKRRIARSFFARHRIDDLAGRSGHWLGQQGRLTEPMYLAPGATHYVPISWDAAYARIARELHACESPDDAVFYTSGRTSNEAAFAYQLLVRALGTNNLPDCSNMCHESTSVGLLDSIGIGKGSVTINDLVMADLIVIAGQNPGTNHPRMLTTLEEAKERGAKIMAINPLPEAGLQTFNNPQKISGLAGHGTHLTDRFLQIKLGGDHALFRALNHLAIAADRERGGTVLDHAFIEERTEGFDALVADLATIDWPVTEAATGLTRDEIEAASEMLLASERTVVCWAMGLTQHRDSVATVQELANLLLLRGQIGKSGAGLCPVRGHSNVQGDRTMGIWERPLPAFVQALEDHFAFTSPLRHGHDVVHTVHAMRDGKVRLFMAMGGNFVSATPDTDLTEVAMRSVGLTVQVSTKLNRSHVVTGREALILPTLGRTDRDVYPDHDAGRAPIPSTGDTPIPAHRGGLGRAGTRSGHPVQMVTVEDSMSMVHGSRGHLKPPSEHVRSEVRIICDLARAALGAPGDAPAGPAQRRPLPDQDDPGPDAIAARTATVRAIPWEAMAADYAVIRRQIEAVVPGFEDFETRVAWPGGFVLPHPPRDSRTFQTDTGKAKLVVTKLEPIEVPDGHLILQTLRSHDQYNTTVYGMSDRYRGIKDGRRIVMVRPSDLDRLGLADGQLVDLVGAEFDGVERRADGFRIVAYPTARGCAAAYYPETNALVPLGSTARRSNTPTSKSVIVRLVPA